jgi:hypothetical protein
MLGKIREWYLYFDTPIKNLKNTIIIDTTYSEHASQMGGYSENKSYQNKDNFFKDFLFRDPRLLIYNDFILKYVKNGDKLISFGCGRCINEAFLLDKGYNVMCSDIGNLPTLNAMQQLFPNFKFEVANVLDENKKYETSFNGVLCLGILYIFNDEQLNTLFQNCNKMLYRDGYLILDSAGSPNSILAHLFHDVFFKLEARLFAITKTIILRERYGVEIHKRGYRRNTNTIIECAKSNGFDLVANENYEFVEDLGRGHIFAFLTHIKFIRPLLSKFTILMPYSRLFIFKKISNPQTNP